MYATVADLVARFGQDEILQLTAAPSAEEIDQARAGLALEDASEVISGYLRPRYRLPIAEVPRLLVSYCCDIARFQLYQGGSRVAPESAKDGYDRAIAFLKAVARGEADLGLAGGAAPPSAPGQVSHVAAPRVIGDALSDFTGH